ncbi:HAD-IIIA family hydrolase [Fastidiosibacter lacustris]|uniref:HAD-IIIA family hydrolase n=1 Tax=Fastidiosibacter lacustris TaxID=2056695 RepID=UPI000E355F5D
MLTDHLNQKIRSVKLLVLDVDGVLSDGKIILSNDGNETKSFDVKDGLGMVLLQKLGIKIAVITGKSSQIVHNRLTALGVQDVYQGQKNKVTAFSDLLEKYHLSTAEAAYMGDDLPDLSIIDKVCVSFAPHDAVHIVKEKVDYICTHRGGHGAVREICDLFLQAHDKYDKVIADYIVHGEAKF